MIVHPLPSGETALIGQTDHSRLVGYMAAHWGNDTFASPDPFDTVARAATYHDFGWLDYETRPLIDQEGRPYNFRDLPFNPAQLEAYQRWQDWLTAIDPYAGLMVARHRTGLWQNRYKTIDHPAMGYNPRGLPPAVAEFVERSEAAQAPRLAEVDASTFAVNYQLLQVWDLLGLYFCYGANKEEYVEPVPTGYNGVPTVRLSITPREPGVVAMDPYPFDVRPLPMQLGCKVVPSKPWPDQEAFRRAYFAAEPVSLKFEVV